MKTATINPALQFIQNAGVTGFVSGVQTGMVPPAQTINALHFVGRAIDTYREAVPQGKVLTRLRARIRALPTQGTIDSAAQEKILGLLTTHKEDVELAVRMAITSGAAVANVKAPYDLGAEWCYIPAGKFQMGSEDNDPYAGHIDERIKTVVTGAFFMLDHPVTNGEFKAFLKATRRKDLRDLREGLDGADQPVMYVTQEEGEAYSKWLGKKVSKQKRHAVIGRLPTEAEWEKAAKGPIGVEFIAPATPQQAHFGARATRSVNHPEAYANGYGLKDMIGNVSEWTSTPWHEEDSSSCITRGGSWGEWQLSYLRAAHRLRWGVDRRCFATGFRPILVLPGSED